MEIKVSTPTELAQRWPDSIDVDAGWIASGRSSVEEIGWELFHYYLDVASGRRRTWAEVHRIHNDLAALQPGTTQLKSRLRAGRATTAIRSPNQRNLEQAP